MGVAIALFAMSQPERTDRADAAASTLPDAAHFAAWADFLLGYTRVMRVVEKELRDGAGINFSQYDVLFNLGAADDKKLAMAQIGESVLFSTGSVTNLVSGMVSRGLVDRARAEHDRRVVFAHLTESGAELLVAATEIILTAVKREFTDLIHDDELEPVTAFFARLRATDRVLRRAPYDLPVKLP